MIHDLLVCWQNGSLPELLRVRPPLPDEKNRSPDDVMVQSSFEFTIAPKVVFVSDFDHYTVAHRYGDLPSPLLTANEQMKLTQARVKFAE